MKKLVALLLALVMCVSLMAGCKSGESTTSEAPSAPVASSAPAGEKEEYTYRSYTSSLGTNWSPHTWVNNADSSILNYVTSNLVSMDVLNSEEATWQWTYDLATAVEDVTADYHDAMLKYGSVLPEGKTIDEVTENYVYKITLREGAKWENGDVIDASDYIYSMKQLLNPTMQNYRSNLYWSGESEIAGASTYYNILKEGAYAAIDYATAMSMDPSEVFIDCWYFWGAEGYTDADGNECPQFVSIADETVYGEAQEDPFSGSMLFADYGAYFEDGSYSLNKFVPNPIQGATEENYEEFYDDTVGVYAEDDYTLIYVLKAGNDWNNFMTSCSSTWLVYEDLYEAGKTKTGDLVTTNYATSPATTMACGPYKIESMQEGKQLVYTQNENWWGYQKQEDGSLYSETDFLVDGQHVRQYQTSRIVINVMDESAAKQAFLKGELDSWVPNAEELINYNTSDRLYQSEADFTMSLIFNSGLEALQAMDASKGNTNSVVLSNDNFRKAMSLAIDRAEWVKTTAGYVPSCNTLSNVYYYDFYNDPTSRYRDSEPAMQAICDLYGVEYGAGKAYATLKDAYQSITGYNQTEAKALFTQACQELVAAGLYKEGEDIVIRAAWKKGPLDSVDNNQITSLQNMINNSLEGTGFGKLTIDALGDVADRYAAVASGEYAITYGAWGGATLYPFRNFLVYCDPSQTGIVDGDGNQYVMESGCWDPTKTDLTMTVNGEEVTMTWKDWSWSMLSPNRFFTADNETKLQILATMEKEFLNFYYKIPLATQTDCELLGYKVNYYTENYSMAYGYGGIRLMTYNYSDSAWNEFVSQQGGTLSYE